MMGWHAAAYLTWLAPLAGFLLITLLGMRISARAASWLGCAAIFVAFLGALRAAIIMPGPSGEGLSERYLLTPYRWLTGGDLTIGLDLYVDRLAVFMMLVVTGVGFLIHVYSVGYMAGDAQQRRFFAYLNIFVWAMLTLVMGGNLVMLLIGWGLVGMASYLLIGFWHDRPSAVIAAKKAFIMNAVGDVSIMLGLFLAFMRYSPLAEGLGGPLTYLRIFEGSEKWLAGHSTVITHTPTVVALLLLGGALAKSAQLPLHTWLPDAMEGPTPVSALIHAATMVTAGVYLVARFTPIFTHTAFAVTATIGAVTLLMAGLIALAQTDIKRIIAYSTMSQIGYMFVGVGVGATGAAMFHLMTHAFFKALLFLGAGIVIHALADEQDVRRMGGLRRHLPYTYALFIIASLALAGIFPFAGFFSKDEILYGAFNKDWSSNGFYASGIWGLEHWGVWALSLAGVLLTGIYSFRLIYLVFHGEESDLVKQYAAGELAGHGHGHEEQGAAVGTHRPHGEAPLTMFAPVALLGLLSILGGLLAIPAVWNGIERFLSGDTAMEDGGAQWLLALLVSTPVAIAGIVIAALVWKTGRFASLRAAFPNLERRCQDAFGWDRLYDALFARPAQALGRFVGVVEREAVGPFMEVVAEAATTTGRGIARLHGGLVRIYALGTAIAVVCAVLIVVWVEG